MTSSTPSPYSIKNSLATTGTLQQQVYIPLVSNLHESPQDLQAIGPQPTAEDANHGFGNRELYTYTPVLRDFVAATETYSPAIFEVEAFIKSSNFPAGGGGNATFEGRR